MESEPKVNAVPAQSTRARTFLPSSQFGTDSYDLMPARMTRLDGRRYMMSGLSGEYMVLSIEDARAVIQRTASVHANLVNELISRNLLAPRGSTLPLELTALQYRTKQSFLPELTSLHIFVVTLRCDHSCPYCQVSRVTADKTQFDMTPSNALHAIELMLSGPSTNLKVEFQGGEPLLNFDLIQFIVKETETRKGHRQVEYVIASNLAYLDTHILDFCFEFGITLSTSLDGPELLHNANRPRPDNDSFARAVAGIHRARERLGPDSVAALMTTTMASLEQPESIIDEYLRLGFRSIFVRWISPYGFASRGKVATGYGTAEYLVFYERALRYIIQLNRKGAFIREEYATIILRKLLTPFASGYVDLQSPTGLGLSALVYNYDGVIYASDESRMIAETGNKRFMLGRLGESNFRDVLGKSGVAELAYETMNEGLVGCADCAFQPYCGTDPVFNLATQGDVIGHRPSSEYCKRNIEIMRLLVKMLEDEPEAAQTLRSWV